MEFLILAMGLIAIGVVVVVVRNRRPRGFDSGIADFEAQRKAIAPQDDPDRYPRGDRAG